MQTEKLIKYILKKSTWNIRDSSNIQMSPSMMNYYIAAAKKI